jgi:hypothetical protein
MLNLPAEITAFLAQFASVFTPTVWYYAQILLIGAILTPGQRDLSKVYELHQRLKCARRKNTPHWR